MGMLIYRKTSFREFFPKCHERAELFSHYYRLLSPADNFCKQVGPRSGPTKLRALPGSELFDTLYLLKDIFV